jgi:PST family polysaccharide transporter
VSLGRKAVRGATWSVASSFAARALGLAGTLLLVRYIAKVEYGEVNAAAVVVLTANQLSTLGVGMYVIAYPKADRAVAFHATLLHLLLGVGALAIAVALRRPLGPVFDVPLMGRYVPGMALSVLIDRLSFMPERILVRDLRFPTVGVARSLGELAYTGGSLALAMRGWGGMSIVLGNVARSVVKGTIIIAAADRRDWLAPAPLRRDTLKVLTSYGAVVSLGGFAAFAARRWDNLLVSRFFGPAVLGAYNLAYNLADVPAVQVGEQVTDVMLSSFAQMEPERRKSALLRSMGLIALIMFPLAAGLGAVAPTLVATVFRPEWADVAPMLMFLSVLSVPRPIAGAIGAYLQAVGRARAATILECVHLVLLLAALATIGRAGPLFACGAVGATFVVRALANMWTVRASDGIPIRRFLAPLLAPLLACLPMVAAVVGIRLALGETALPGWMQLAAEVVAGALVYVAAALVIAREASRDLLRLALRRG